MSCRRPEPSEYHPRYARYLDLVPEADVIEAMRLQGEDTSVFLAGIAEDLYEHRYAADKWTLREVLGHILDTERILGFRMLTIARGGVANFVRADQDAYVRNAEFGRWPLVELAGEFALVRRSNMLMLRHLPPAAWDLAATVSDATVSVRALAYLMLGHERYHLAMIRERYLAA